MINSWFVLLRWSMGFSTLFEALEKVAFVLYNSQLFVLKIHSVLPAPSLHSMNTPPFALHTHRLQMVPKPFFGLDSLTLI